MITKQYVILAAQGLHARPATNLIKLAKGFQSTINLQKGAKTIKLNSMLNLLSLAVKGGDQVNVTIEGEDEIPAAETLDKFFNEELKEL